jgi:hypothetical protein
MGQKTTVIDHRDLAFLFRRETDTVDLSPTPARLADFRKCVEDARNLLAAFAARARVVGLRSTIQMLVDQYDGVLHAVDSVDPDIITHAQTRLIYQRMAEAHEAVSEKYLQCEALYNAGFAVTSGEIMTAFYNASHLKQLPPYATRGRVRRIANQHTRKRDPGYSNTDGSGI